MATTESVEDDIRGIFDGMGLGGARRANELNVEANLSELDEMMPMIEKLFAQSRKSMLKGYASGRKVIGGYLEQGSALFDSALAEIEAGYEGANDALDAQAGAAQESGLAAQQQSLAAAQQGMVSRGLANTSVGSAMARGIAGDTTRALGQTMARIGAQKAQLGVSMGSAKASTMQSKAGFLGQSAGMLGALETGQGSDLASLLQSLASQKLNLAGMKSAVRNSIQHVAGPSAMDQLGQGLGIASDAKSLL